MDALANRVLGWASVEGGAPRGSKIRAAWIVVLLHIAVRLALSLLYAGAPRWLMALPALAFVAGWWRRLMRPVAVVLALVQCARFAAAYPDVSNHYLVECLAIVVFAVVDLERDPEAGLCLDLLRWLGVTVLFLSGLQKCLHGTYFKGQFLAYMVANAERFRLFFRPMLSAPDLAHLTSLDNAINMLPLKPAGPYRVHSLLFVAVSNAVWLGELLLPVGLLIKRTRSLALVGALVLMAGILVSSNELFFDTLFINLLLLFARSDVNWKLLPLSLASYGYYLLAGFGLVRGSFVW